MTEPDPTPLITPGTFAYELAAAMAEARSQKVTVAAASTTLNPAPPGSRDVTLKWGRNLGDASYQVDLLPSDDLPEGATFTVKTTYATSAIVTIKTTAPIAQGGMLAAVAWRHEPPTT